ncbi:hypothetical protein M569_02183 [Genlisea aurea]|uniref:Uncharacterized protein n=1 Tax=Genlisea aurea TaxID=192259 RepID=S8CYQ1_9LAMI|nr:hypothetical protein M569_02183 [Genlisea aurea]
MLLRRAAVIALSSGVAVKLSNGYCSGVTRKLPPKGKHFLNIPSERRSSAVQELQKALAEYLHTTRCLPFIYADNIARNSPESLGNVVSKLKFSRCTYADTLHKFLRYHPINELDFFLESIGLFCEENAAPLPPSLLPPETLFLSDWKHFTVFCALSGMGFPWNKMSSICKDETLLNNMDHLKLQWIFDRIKDEYGFGNESLISICLVFPRVLNGRMDGLLSHLKALLLDSAFLSTVDSDVDAIVELCERIKLLLNLGGDMGRLVELMRRNKRFFLKYPKEVLVSKVNYFCKFATGKDQIGVMLLSRPEIFDFDIENRRISVAGFLKHFGFPDENLKCIMQKYPHVFGMNRIANLPNILRSVNLCEWFFERMIHGDPSLFSSYTIGSTEESDETYTNCLIKVRARKTRSYVMKKLNFIHSIGFGENRYAVKALSRVRGNVKDLQVRFDCILEYGIEYYKACTLLRRCKIVLNQNTDVLLKKLDFLSEMGMPLDILDEFPGYLCYNLEKRIIPRWQIHKWVLENGFSDKHYNISTVIATSGKNFAARIGRIHPDALKKWREMQ